MVVMGMISVPVLAKETREVAFQIISNHLILTGH